MPARLARRVLRIALVLLAGCSAVLAVGTAEAQGRKEVRVGVAGLPDTLDPASALEGATPLIARQVFDTLVAYRDGSTDIEPALATRWSTSRDGLVWKFTLRDNVRFHDGAPLAASDVAESFDRLLRAEPDARSPVWTRLLRGTPGVVRSVRAVDARTLTITLSQPYAPLVTVLAHPGFSVVRALTAADGTRTLLGTGPYRVVDRSPGRLALEAVPHWSGAARSERLLFLEVGSEEDAEAEMDARSLDVWFAPRMPRRAEGTLSIPGIHVGYLALQTEKEPFSRRASRKAVAAALDPAALGAALDGAAVPLQSFLPPGIWARREGSPILGGTREAVRRLLVEGQWPHGHAPTMLYPSDRGLAGLAQTLQRLLGAVDIPIVLRPEPFDAVKAALQAGEHELALMEASVAGGDPHLLLFPLSTSEGATKGPRALNYSFYRNPRLDDVLIRASQLGFRPERERLYRRAQALLAEELPWIPVYSRLLWAVARPEVRGLRLHPVGVPRLTRLALEGEP
jgi:peptide/nickel transport system substrate-binding protein